MELGSINNDTGLNDNNNRNCIRTIDYIQVLPNTTYSLSNDKSYNILIYEYDKNKNFIQYTGNFATPKYWTTQTNTYYIRVRSAAGSVQTDLTAKYQLELGNTTSTYIVHREEDYDINLGKNLFNKDDSSVIFNGFVNGSTSKLVSSANTRTICLPCKTNTTYTISKIISTRFVTAETTSTTIAGDISVTINSQASTTTSQTITTSANAKYLLVFYYLSTSDTLSEEEIRNSIQIEIGSQATTYADYFTPIELCKIGDYQDYIYKNNGKWFVHKEIGKKTVTNGDDFSLYQQNVGNNVYQYRTANNYLINAKLSPDPFNIEDIAYSNYFAKKNGINNLNNYYFTITGTGALAINTPYASINSLKTWLAGIDLKFYYELATATEEEITYEPLIAQLDKLDKIGLYDISNISQDNSDMKMLLDFTICNDNYNGLKEFIRA